MSSWDPGSQYMVTLNIWPRTCVTAESSFERVIPVDMEPPRSWASGALAVHPMAGCCDVATDHIG